jgi:spermidine synthase
MREKHADILIIGGSTGGCAAFCLQNKVAPHQVGEDHERLSLFQDFLRKQGIELEWPSIYPV